MSKNYLCKECQHNKNGWCTKKKNTRFKKYNYM